MLLALLSCSQLLNWLKKKLKEKLNPAVLVPPHVNNCSSYHKRITGSGRIGMGSALSENPKSSGQALFYALIHVIKNLCFI